jgi:hypothetical protein
MCKTKDGDEEVYMKRLHPLLSILFALTVACNLLAPTSQVPYAEQPSKPTLYAPTIEIPPVAPPPSGHITSSGSSNIVRVWANPGTDKVTRDELRASIDPDGVLNAVWDGTSVSQFGARNEVVAFNLVLEANTSPASNVSLWFPSFEGPNGASITTRDAAGDDLFNTIGRNIELFYIRYLEIRGISTDLFYTGYDYDERHIPERCRRPYDADGEGSGGWSDRACHNKLYPEIAVPLELHSPFDIAAGTNQSIWVDIFIPKSTPAGEYMGTITISEDGKDTWEIPVNLRVHDFSLPDLPNARTMLVFSQENINDRYLGEAYPSPGSQAYTQGHEIVDRHFQVAHRHKISLIGNPDGYTPVEQMGEAWIPRLSGDLFTPERGYDGVGVGVGNNVYAIGEYGSWPWQDGSRGDMWTNTDAWVNWFDAQGFTTQVEYFLYLIDESDDYDQIERWAKWIEDNPGPGGRLLSMATIDLPIAAENTPSLDIPTSLKDVSLASEWQSAADLYLEAPDKRFFMYNSNRPSTGSFAIEDEGISPVVLVWTQFKMGIDRWFYWESTYYENFQCYGYGGEALTNIYQQAQTFGCYDEFDDSLGETGWNYLNGDGVLFYPGTDTRYPEESYDLMGPFASLRLKLWRRGIQDVDYLHLAMQVDPERTAQIVQAMIPEILWEIGVTDPEDPTYVLTDISWSTNPDVWEAARSELANIILGASP